MSAPTKLAATFQHYWHRQFVCTWPQYLIQQMILCGLLCEQSSRSVPWAWLEPCLIDRDIAWWQLMDGWWGAHLNVNQSRVNLETDLTEPWAPVFISRRTAAGGILFYSGYSQQHSHNTVQYRTVQNIYFHFHRFTVLYSACHQFTMLSSKTVQVII